MTTDSGSPRGTHQAASTRAQPEDVAVDAGRSTQTPAMYVFWLMFGINAVNYLDRYVVVAVAPALKSQFQLHDQAIGLLTTAFILVYTLSALPLGLVADRFSRPRVVALGVGLWSIVSTATAFTRTFATLFATRAAVGIGEASYYPAGTALLSAYFPLRRRARIMGLWQAGQLVGVALAFGVTALVYHFVGPSAWRPAFFVTGVPGIVLAILAWRIKDRVAEDVEAAAGTPGAPELMVDHVVAPPMDSLSDAWEHIIAVMRIGTVQLIVVLQALFFAISTPAVTFLPIYLASTNSPFHLNRTQATVLSGGLLVVGGLAGTMLGGFAADFLSSRLRGGRVATAAVGFGVALPCYVAMLLTGSLVVFIVAALLAVFALNLPAGPLSAAVQDATPPASRATAVAVTLLLGHLLGDVWAPTAVGAVSTALADHAATALLIVGTPLLVLATIVGVIAARIYADDLNEQRTLPDVNVLPLDGGPLA